MPGSGCRCARLSQRRSVGMHLGRPFSQQSLLCDLDFAGGGGTEGSYLYSSMAAASSAASLPSKVFYYYFLLAAG